MTCDGSGLIEDSDGFHPCEDGRGCDKCMPALRRMLNLSAKAKAIGRRCPGIKGLRHPLYTHAKRNLMKPNGISSLNHFAHIGKSASVGPGRIRQSCSKLAPKIHQPYIHPKRPKSRRDHSLNAFDGNILEIA